MGWQCKLCTFVATRKGAILKHYRLNHGTFGRGYSVPCLHLNCPCSFKTWGGLRTHLHRCHNSQETKDCEVLSVESLKCKLCDSLYFNTKDYFKHINSHLKSHETVQCVFKGCNFKTNICATYATHRSRNHKSWSLEDFETDLIAKQPASTDYEISSPVSHDHVDIDNTEELDCERDASSQIAKNIGSLLLKLESIYNVSGKCIDDLVEQLQFICTSSTQYVPKLVDDIFTKNDCAVDQDVVRELVDKLCHSNPLNLAFCPKGPFSTKLKREKYFKENFNVTEPVEYILDQEENHSFQNIPFLQTLQHLLNNEDILNHILTKHSNTSHLASFHDGLQRIVIDLVQIIPYNCFSC